MPKVLLFSSAFEIVAGLMLTKFFGIQGMVWTFFLVKPIQALFMWIESRKVFTFTVNRIKIFYIPFLFLGFVVGSEWLVTEGNRIIIHVAQCLVSIILVWLAYRREIISLLRKQLDR